MKKYEQIAKLCFNNSISNNWLNILIINSTEQNQADKLKKYLVNSNYKYHKCLLDLYSLKLLIKSYYKILSKNKFVKNCFDSITRFI